ncbi:MAG: hypothetical protein KC978_09985, partial [Candidatus Omnitrophica bacterium]|nr:hypothetical protein [Candidatus Omnitrophota bacterium]
MADILPAPTQTFPCRACAVSGKTAQPPHVQEGGSKMRRGGMATCPPQDTRVSRDFQAKGVEHSCSTQNATHTYRKLRAPARCPPGVPRDFAVRRIR